MQSILYSSRLRGRESDNVYFAYEVYAECHRHIQRRDTDQVYKETPDFVTSEGTPTTAPTCLLKWTDPYAMPGAVNGSKPSSIFGC